MTPQNDRMPLADWGLLIFLSVLWGGSFLFIGIAVKELPPLVIVMARVVIAAAVLLPIHFVMQGGLPRDGHRWFKFAVMAALNNVIPFTLIVIGQTKIASGLASIINATAPLFATVILAVARQDRLVARKLLGLVAGVAGVVVLKGDSTHLSAGQGLGIMLVLGAAASYGFAGLWAKLQLNGIPPMTLATGQLVCSSLMMMVLATVFDRPAALLEASATSWLAIVGLALLATSLAYLVFFRIIARSGPANVLLVTMLIPVSAILMGYWFLGETLNQREIVGALIIIGGLVIIDGRALSFLNASRAGNHPA